MQAMKIINTDDCSFRENVRINKIWGSLLRLLAASTGATRWIGYRYIADEADDGSALSHQLMRKTTHAITLLIKQNGQGESCPVPTAYDAIATSLLRQNDFATSLWHNNHVIIASCARCGRKNNLHRFQRSAGLCGNQRRQGAWDGVSLWLQHHNMAGPGRRRG